MRPSFRAFQKVLSSTQALEQLESINKTIPTGTWQLITRTGADGGVETLLENNYKFKNFSKTWQFLNGAALIAHLERHHPTITTTYNKVNFEITTHDVGNQVTRKDLKLAQKIQNLYADYVTEEKIKASPLPGFLGEARELVDQTKAADVISELTKR